MKKLPRFIRHPVRERFLQKVTLALSVALWLFRLPIIVRIYSLSGLLERLTRTARSHKKQTALELKEAVPIVTRICYLRLFGARVFPRACLRQSLTLYRVLTRMGYPVEIHFGVRKAGDDLLGHSWVTIEGKPLADGTQTYLFKAVYSYPSVSRPSNSRDTSQLLQACLSTRGGNHGKGKSSAIATTTRRTRACSVSVPDKKPWQEPKLAFVEPKLTKHGSLEEVTGQGFFGGFTPPTRLEKAFSGRWANGSLRLRDLTLEVNARWGEDREDLARAPRGAVLGQNASLGGRALSSSFRPSS